MNYLRLKTSDAADRQKWRKVIGGNWSNSNNDGDAVV